MMARNRPMALTVGLALACLCGTTSVTSALADTQAHSPYDSYLTWVRFANANVGWVCGYTDDNPGSLFYRTVDGGKTWTASYLNDIADLIAPGDGTHAWLVALDGTVYKTANTGATWSTSWTPDQLWTQHWSSCASIGSQDVWVAGGQTILHSTDGGSSWNAQTFPDTDGVAAITFADASHGWAVSDTTIWYTTDGGDDWESQATYPDETLQGVSCRDADTAWAVGADGLALTTTDAGQDWASPSNTDLSSYSLLDAGLVDSGHGWIVGGGPYNGVILHTTDGGTTWDDQSEPSDSVQSIDAIDADDAWAVANTGGLLHTSDGGQSWSGVSLPRIAVSIHRSPGAAKLTYTRHHGVAKFTLAGYAYDAWGVVWANLRLQSSANGRSWRNVSGVAFGNFNGIGHRSFAVKTKGKTYYRWVVPSSTGLIPIASSAQLVTIK